MNKRLLLFLLLLPVCWASLSAQKKVRQNIRQGNEHYDKSEYLESEIAYRKALEGNAADSIAKFNLGNALYRQQKADAAMEQYMATATGAERSGDLQLAAKAYFNAGDVCLATQDYARAEELFKQSLRMDPSDHDARYNMILARKLKQQQEQQQENQDQNQNQDNKSDEQKQQEQQQQNQQNQDQQQQDEQQQNRDQKEDRQQQEQQEQNQQSQSANAAPKMSQEQIEAILNAANQEEKDVQDKVREQLMKQTERKRTDKDW